MNDARRESISTICNLFTYRSKEEARTSLKNFESLARVGCLVVVEMLLNVNMFLCVRQYAKQSCCRDEWTEKGILSSIRALFDIVSLTTQHNNNAEKSLSTLSSGGWWWRYYASIASKTERGEWKRNREIRVKSIKIFSRFSTDLKS